MNFTPLHDMILVKPDQVKDKIGSIFVPQGSIQGPDQPGDSRDTGIGTVVAIGPGDKHKLVERMRCTTCRKMYQFDALSDSYTCACPHGYVSEEYAALWNAGRYPMLIEVGDRVVFPRRPASAGGEFSCMIEGETYMMFNEEQNCLAVLEE
jgi:co-chaperonin GroES (HSP10)